MQRFLTLLQQIDLDLDPEEIADALWLAGQLDPSTNATPDALESVSNQPVLGDTDRAAPLSNPHATQQRCCCFAATTIRPGF